MSRIYISGLGAVSPAGWGVAPMCEVLEKREVLPVQSLPSPGRRGASEVRPVPPPAVRPAFLTHPRLRRASPITHYTVAAGLEALSLLSGEARARARIGLLTCLQSGCVQYSHRFFEETLKDPSTASPLLFPETVFAAPASHLAALLGTPPMTYTLMGDPGTFLQGVATGIQWLEEDRVDVCLIVGAEETDWLLADALWKFEHAAVLSCGAGALCITADPALSMGVELLAITDSHTYSSKVSRCQAAAAVCAQLPPSHSDLLLVDGLSESLRANAAEAKAWRNWTGPRLSPKRYLGEGLMAAAAWQCVTACEALARRGLRGANVSLVGSNQQAIGAHFGLHRDAGDRD